MIRNENPLIANSLWSATANAAPPTPRLEGETSAEVAIVGAGFCGLSAALHMAERGLSVVVLEAQSPGWGASGRNGGQVIPGLKEDPDGLVAHFGETRGQSLIELGGGAADLVFELVRRHGIDCDAVQGGWIQPAAGAEGLAVSRARVEQWQRRGAPVDSLSREEVAELIGGGGYEGGLLDRRGGGLHPLNYALGLAAAAQRAGAAIHGDSEVLALEATRDGHRLRTAHGSVLAGQVFLCTNGYSGPLVDPLRRSLVPVRSVQVATAPLSENLRRSILPGGQVASDTRKLLLYFRLDRDGRLIMGGRGAYSDRPTAAQMAKLRRVTARMFPQLGEVDWAFQWGGFVALTADHFPHLDRIRPGVVSMAGFNGRGVAMATAAGRVLADMAAGVPDEELPFPVLPPRPIPFHFLRKPAVGAMIAWSRLRDAVQG